MLMIRRDVVGLSRCFDNPSLVEAEAQLPLEERVTSEVQFQRAHLEWECRWLMSSRWILRERMGGGVQIGLV